MGKMKIGNHKAPRAGFQRDALIAAFGGSFTVIDATFDLVVVPTADDFKRGNRKDPQGCAYALACRRNFNSTSAVFFRRVAYVDLPVGKSGKRQVYRFHLDKHASDNIINFDLGKQDLFEGAIILRKIASSQTLAGLAQARERRKAAGPYTPTTERTVYQRTARNLDIRNGSGLIQQIAKTDPLIRKVS